MNQFAKYSSGEPDQVTKETPSIEQLVHELHNDFIGVAQSIADLKQTVSALNEGQEKLKEELGQFKAIQPESSKSTTESVQESAVSLEEETLPQPESSETIVSPTQEAESPDETTEPQQEGAGATSDNALGMSDAEIQALLEEAAKQPLPPDDFPHETDEHSETDQPPLPDFVPEQFREPESRFLPEPTFEISKDAVRAVPAALAIGALAIPVAIEEKTLLCRSVEPFDYAALDLIQAATGLKVSAEGAPIDEVVNALRKCYRHEAYDSERESVIEIASEQKKSRRQAA